MKNDYLKYIDICLQVITGRWWYDSCAGGAPLYIDHPLAAKFIISLGEMQKRYQESKYLDKNPWNKLVSLRYGCFSHFKMIIKSRREEYLRGEITKDQYKMVSLFAETLSEHLRHYSYEQVFDLLEKEIELEELLNTQVDFENSVVQSIY